MKNLLKISAAAACVSLAFMAASCNRPFHKPDQDLLKYELKGNVASVRSIPYSVDSVAGGYEISGVEASMNNIYAEFNEDGMVTRLQRFNRNGDLVSTQENTYNPDGLIAESVITSAAGEPVEKSVYVYRAGRLASLTVTDAEDSLKKYETYKYYGLDSLKATFSYKEGETAGYRIMEYDENGHNTANITYSSKNGKVLSRFDLEYDSLGRSISVKSDNIFFGEMNSEMTYDEEGQRSSLLMDSNRGETLFSFKFKVDSVGNWVERETYRNDEPRPLRVEKREIVYR